MTEYAPLRPDSIGVDNDRASHTLKLRLMTFEGGVPTTVEVTIDPNLIPEFMAQVVSHGGYVLRQIAEDYMLGDCPTCKNIRLVDVMKGNRKTNDHCPNCNPTGRNRPDPLAASPKINDHFAKKD